MPIDPQTADPDRQAFRLIREAPAPTSPFATVEGSEAEMTYTIDDDVPSRNLLRAVTALEQSRSFERRRMSG